MKIGGQFQQGITERVRAVHTEQDHLPVGRQGQGNFLILSGGRAYGRHPGLQRMGTLIATVQIHDKIVVGFPQFTHTASSLGWESRSGNLGPRPAKFANTCHLGPNPLHVRQLFWTSF